MQPPQRSDPDDRGTTFRILLIEDNDDHAALIRRACKRTRFNVSVEWMSDGVSSLQFLRAHDNERPDLVLLDVNLPGMSGHDILRAIRTDPDLRFMPVVVLSTSSNELDLTQAYQSHANSYVTKPERFDELCQMVTDLIAFWRNWNVAPPCPQMTRSIP